MPELSSTLHYFGRPRSPNVQFDFFDVRQQHTCDDRHELCWKVWLQSIYSQIQIDSGTIVISIVSG